MWAKKKYYKEKKHKMWCLVNKKTGRIVPIWTCAGVVLGFLRKKDIIPTMVAKELNEYKDKTAIRKVEFDVG